MSSTLSRRDFIKLSLLAGCTLAFRNPPAKIYPDGFEYLPLGIGRVTTTLISIFEKAGFSNQRIGTYRRDQIVLILREVQSTQGPRYNPRWYQTPDGFVHSAYLQRVQPVYNMPVTYLPPGDQLGEITTASLVSMQMEASGTWRPRYHLYYGSLHWITGITTGPHPPQPWVQITDDLLRVKHYVPAVYVRMLSPQELNPISPHIPPHEKRIQVSLASQTLTAFEREKAVFHTTISTGVENEGEVPEGEIPTETPTGRFYIGNKMPSRHMGEGDLTGSAEDYELLGVPWVCFFHETGAAFHGTYWHDNFGRRMSHGCVNLRTSDARWLYLWTTPTLKPDEWHRIENGTVVDIF